MSKTIDIEVVGDASMLDGFLKFVHPDGREQVFDLQASEVLDIKPTQEGE